MTTPTPEAIPSEAIEAALATLLDAGEVAHPMFVRRLTAALTAAAPFIAAQAKAEALAEIANDYMGEFPFMREVWHGPTHPASNAAREIATKTLKWLNARAETIESEA